MRLLLDTHTFLWWDKQRSSLSQTALSLLQNKANTLYLSMVSVWEMQIKHQLGKLNVLPSVDVLVAQQQQLNDLQVLSIEMRHIMALYRIPMAHRDPFDRLLISTALVENLTIVTADAVFSAYPVATIW